MAKKRDPWDLRVIIIMITIIIINNNNNKLDLGCASRRSREGGQRGTGVLQGRVVRQFVILLVHLKSLINAAL